MRRTLARGGALAAAIAAATCHVAFAAEPQARPRRVLAIHAFDPGVPVDALFTVGLRAGLPLGDGLELYSEYLDRVRFPGGVYQERFLAWLRAKYAEHPPDVIVAVGPDALDFAANSEGTPFPGVPVVFGFAFDATVAGMRLPPNVTGLTEHLAMRENLDLALTLFPDTEHVALIGGASATDRVLNALLRRETARSERRLDVIELFGLPMAELQARLRALPPRTVILAVSLLEDGAGRKFTGPQVVPMITAATSAPLFISYAHILGLGGVGGVVTDVEASGRETAKTVLRVLAGERPEAIAIRSSGSNRLLLDGRQLDRLRVPDARIPAGAEVRFREAPFWVRYRWIVLATLVALLLESALIGLLLVERRRRWRAEAKARENLAILAHMNRVSTVGELVGSLAHEINSPLGAALNNAEAALRLLGPGTLDEAEVRSCLDDIVRDVMRAGAVLRRIRGVLRKETWTPVELDLETVIRDARRLVKAEARDRGVELEVVIAPDLPSVTGDEVQLSQVCVNLLINALEAVTGAPEQRRRVRIDAGPRGGSVAIRVVDWGSGIPPDVAARVFEPFFTTKTVGLGMGLPISRSIVEAHGGSIRVSQAEGGGAAFEVVLPASQGAAKAKAPV